MRSAIACGRRLIVLSALIGAIPTSGRAEDEGWIDLSGLDTWRKPTGAWAVVGGVHLDEKDPRRLAADPGEGVIYNGPAGRTNNLVSTRAFGDVEVQLEFLVPKGSNSGIKLEGVYEVQIFDSFGKKSASGSDNGGIYPRAEFLPTYHHIDDGSSPRMNASRPAGEWQTLDVTYRAPRFDPAGKKVAGARFEKVVLNGKVIHEGVEVPYPTGNAWHDKEKPSGPLLLQADHGPVAFRNIRARPLDDGRR